MVSICSKNKAQPVFMTEIEDKKHHHIHHTKMILDDKMNEH